MARKINIIEVRETENNRFAVTYETGTIKEYPADKLPKTVISWIAEHQEPEQEETETEETEETTKAAETVAEVESEEVATQEAGTAENVAEREESTMKKSGAYEHELLKLARNRERREKHGGIFWNLETVVLILSGLMLMTAAAIVYGLAVAASWTAANVPEMISAAQKATQKAIEATRTAAEIATDTFKVFFHMGRKAATVAATIITMITR